MKTFLIIVSVILAVQAEFYPFDGLTYHRLKRQVVSSDGTVSSGGNVGAGTALTATGTGGGEPGASDPGTGTIGATAGGGDSNGVTPISSQVPIGAPVGSAGNVAAQAGNNRRRQNYLRRRNRLRLNRMRRRNPRYRNRHE